MLSIRNLFKAFPGVAAAGRGPAINGVSFDVARGEFFTLLGPSGCGKTTTLQCIAGLETPTSGRIEMDGRAVFCSDSRALIPANRRNLGMVFQSYAIWPHLTVFENVAFPLRYGGRPLPSAEIRPRVMRALERVKLQEFADRPSPHLSGGQQQRVALARALVHEPALLLLDEPLSNLDAKLRDTMRIEIRDLVKALGITTIFVTHDQLEAMSMSDTIVLMRAGEIVQKGPPRDVFLRPEAAFTADFMGRSNLVPGTLSGPKTVKTLFGPVEVGAAPDLPVGSAVFLVVRPHALVASRPTQAAGPATNRFRARIESQAFLGDIVEADIVLAGQALRIALDPYLAMDNGAEVIVDFPVQRCVAVPTDASLLQAVK
jgi:iron(III) transport system ATP-binding protein